jgi:hypothetical protein
MLIKIPKYDDWVDPTQVAAVERFTRDGKLIVHLKNGSKLEYESTPDDAPREIARVVNDAIEQLKPHESLHDRQTPTSQAGQVG